MNVTAHHKYPRTFHVPWSEGITDDDKVVQSMDNFIGKDVVVTTKYDGENTTMYNDIVHARSIDSGYHPSRTWVQNLHATVKYKLSANQRVCGENMFWVKSIVYTDLPSYFLMFSFWEDDVCFSWDKTVELSKTLDIDTTEVIYRGIYDERTIKALYDETMEDTMEGYVIRLASSFTVDTFKDSVAKFVRKDHVQTDQHWMRTGGELNMIRLKRNK